MCYFLLVDVVLRLCIVHEFFVRKTCTLPFHFPYTYRCTYTFIIRVIQIDQISSFLGLISSKSCGDFWGFCKIGISTFTSCAINDMWYRPV